MASILGSQGVVLATAMAVSGTVILLALRLQKSLPPAAAHQFPVIGQVDPQSPQQALRSCISSDVKNSSKKVKNSSKKKKNKRVHFAEDVVDPIGYSEEFRRKHRIIISSRARDDSSTDYYYDSSIPSPSSDSTTSPPEFKKISGKVRGMPANRAALYNGILRDRVVHRLACSY